MPAHVLGLLDHSLTVDEDQHRDYRVRFLVKADLEHEVEEAVGIPSIGSNLLFPNLIDPFALRVDEKPKITKATGIPNHWNVEITYSTKLKGGGAT